MKVVITTSLNINAYDAWALVKQSSTLVYVCRGLLSFKGSSNFPVEWAEGETISTRLKLLSLIPAWKHIIHFKQIDNLKLITEEQGGFVKKWHHKIVVEPLTDTTCLYTDTIEISAGLLTPAIGVFAYIFYHYRQSRWRRLIQLKG